MYRYDVGVPWDPASIALLPAGDVAGMGDGDGGEGGNGGGEAGLPMFSPRLSFNTAAAGERMGV